MRLVVLSDCETSGGAAIAATRLILGLSEAGHDVVRLVHLPGDANRGGWAVRPLLGVHVFGSRLRRRFAAGGWASRLLASAARVQLGHALEALRPDAISVHNLHGAGWDPETVAVCAQHAPTTWTLHDMWSFTGRCAYSYECRKFISGCDSSCPTPAEYPALPPARIALAWRERRRLLAECDGVCGVTPSRWLRREATAGLWSGRSVEVIPGAVPTRVFWPEERARARARFGLDARRPVLLLAAHDLGERRKGGALLFEALRHLRRRPLTVLLAGGGRLPAPSATPAGVELRALGRLADERDMAWAYSAADLLVHAAPVDNFPNVVLESLACGTPVVAFPTGGVPEIVRPGLTGWLAGDTTPSAFAAAVDGALASLAGGLDLRDACRAVAENEYPLHLQATRYVDLLSALRESAVGRAPAAVRR
jgi:glycosyltransferase involved in cell wall biosynthesis